MLLLHFYDIVHQTLISFYRFLGDFETILLGLGGGGGELGGGVRTADGNPYPIRPNDVIFPTLPFSRPDPYLISDKRSKCIYLTLFQTTMVKIYTLFQTKTAKTKHTLWGRTYLYGL